MTRRRRSGSGGQSSVPVHGRGLRSRRSCRGGMFGNSNHWWGRIGDRHAAPECERGSQPPVGEVQRSDTTSRGRHVSSRSAPGRVGAPPGVKQKARRRRVARRRSGGSSLERSPWVTGTRTIQAWKSSVPVSTLGAPSSPMGDQVLEQGHRCRSRGRAPLAGADQAGDDVEVRSHTTRAPMPRLSASRSRKPETVRWYSGGSAKKGRVRTAGISWKVTGAPAPRSSEAITRACSVE